MYTLQAFRTLIAVSEEGGVSSAAQHLGRTPSAVSMALGQLELEVGGPLFEGKRKDRLTKLGRVVVARAHELLAHYDNTCAIINNFARDGASQCHVASVVSFATVILPRALQAMQTFPENAKIQIEEKNSSLLIDLVGDGVVDLAFGRMTRKRQGVTFEPLLHDAYDLVCRRDHPLAQGKAPVKWSDIDPSEFICNDSFGDLQLPGFADVVSQSKFRTTSIISTFGLVEQSIGITLMPRLCRSQAPSTIEFVSLEDAQASRVVGLITKKDRHHSKLTISLIESVKTVLNQHHCPGEFEVLTNPPAG